MSIQVSFVIPCYNEVDYIGKCINSIRHQGIEPKSYEIIVVDNGSRDGTDELASELGAIVLTNPRRGAAASRNMGALHAKGETLAFVDADCILDSAWVTKLTSHLAKPHVCAVAAPAVPIETGMTWVERAWSKVFVCFPRNTQGDIVHVSNLASSNMLVPAHLFRNIGGFDENLLSCEDYDLSQRLLNKGTLLLDSSLVVTHLRESKTISELFRREVGRGRYSLRCFKKNGYRPQEIPSIAIPFISLIILINTMVHVLIGNFLIVTSSAMLLMMIPSIYLIRSTVRLDSVYETIQEYIVSAAYVAARTNSLIRELYDISCDMMSGIKGDRQ